ncbi:hypothetical protein [Stenotrophomonas maltophilia]|uniref:hypothetical protein n=1 Tax=Stenotrophomonas maltophilia TaxID=40324 RepID=UPI0021C79F8E|nr:hypothetical protein [Stenotrophomonas maltophilia]MCU1023333.1 hypothetical protein [Stenotrophomonas maltophilia]
MNASIAAAMGFDDLYGGSEAFRERFDEMLGAVKALPEGLQERGRSLMYPQLHDACVMGDVELVTALLATGLDPDAYTHTDDDEDQTPLVWLARDMELDFEVKCQVAEALIAAGASVGEGEPEEEAKNIGDDDFASFLHAKGLGLVTQASLGGISPLAEVPRSGEG